MVVRVISSLDSPFAIPETFSCVFRKANKICVCSPWIEKSFIYLMKETVAPNTYLNFLIKTPEEHDRTFRAIEALETESREMRWKVNIVCTPNLHAKFIVVNDVDIFFGSSNATNSGLYYNNEVLLAFSDMPEISDQFVKVFENIKRQRCNHSWELVRDFHGPSADRRLVEVTVSYLGERAHTETRIPLLVSELQRHGYYFNRAKEGVQEMLKHGVLYSPREGFVKLVPKFELSPY